MLMFLLHILLTLQNSFSYDPRPVDSVVQQAVRGKVLPGGVLIVGQGGKILHCKAYGLGPAGNNTFDTIYDVASLTKVIATATSFMLLEEKGLASLSDKISTYFPEFSGGNKDLVTVEDLLRHRSGLSAGKTLIPGESYSDFIKRVLTDPLIYTPRSKVVYSDLSMILLAEVVKKISTQSMGDFLRDQLFIPLGMSNTFYQVPMALGLNCAFTFPDRQCLPHDPIAYNFFPTEVGHAGIFSTADDLIKVVRMFAMDGFVDGKPFMKSETIKKMTVLPPRTTRGLGWDLLSEYSPAPRGDVYPKGISYGHTGYTGTTIWIDPISKSYYLFLSNRVLLGDRTTKAKFSAFRKKLATTIGSQIYSY